MHKKLTLAAVVAAVVVGASPAAAQAPAAALPTMTVPPAPTAAEIQKVTNYFLNGKDGGPILIELSLCADVKKSPEGKLACIDPLGETIKKGETLTAFVKFFGPRGGKYEDVKLRFVLDGEVRTTTDFSVTESWTGYSNYKKTTASKAGTWVVEVMRGESTLGKRTIVAQ